MDNQHRLIKSYRDLNAEEIALINQIKAAERELLGLIDEVRDHITNQVQAYSKANDTEAIERVHATNAYEWNTKAKSDIETGFMALVRSVAQPYNGPQ
jgi:hypothetical protein